MSHSESDSESESQQWMVLDQAIQKETSSCHCDRTMTSFIREPAFVIVPDPGEPAYVMVPDAMYYISSIRSWRQHYRNNIRDPQGPPPGPPSACHQVHDQHDNMAGSLAFRTTQCHSPPGLDGMMNASSGPRRLMNRKMVPHVVHATKPRGPGSSQDAVQGPSEEPYMASEAQADSSISGIADC